MSSCRAASLVALLLLAAPGLAAQGLPDLRLTDVEVSRASVPRGGAFTVGVTVVNDGPGNVNFATVSLALSTGDVFDLNSDVEAGVSVAAPLPAGAALRLTIDGEVPSALAAGDYTLFVVVDGLIPGGFIAESDETNNVAALSFTVEAGVEGPLPDLALVSVDVPDQPLVPGDWIAIHATAASSGEPRPENVYSEAFLSADETISDDDIALGGPLGYGGLSCSNNNCTFQIGRGTELPRTVAEGAYFVIVNAQHDAADADSSNNVRAVAVAVGPPPLRITVDPASVPTVPAGGGPVAVAALAVAGLEPVVFSWYAILERPDGSEMGVAFQNDVPLDAGETAVLQTAFVIAAGDPVGEYALTFYTEQQGQARLEWGQAVVTKTAATASEADPDAVTSLSVAAPNPTAHRSRIAYQTATMGAVRLTVLDALGREVGVLVDQVLSAGPYAATLDASALPAGLYIVRLDADGQSHVSRFTVAR